MRDTFKREQPTYNSNSMFGADPNDFVLILEERVRACCENVVAHMREQRKLAVTNDRFAISSKFENGCAVVTVTYSEALAKAAEKVRTGVTEFYGTTVETTRALASAAVYSL